MNQKKIQSRNIIVSLFNFLLLAVPLYFRVINEELFEFNKMILVYLMTTLIVSGWLLRMIQEKRIIIKKTPLDIPLILFIVSQLISTIFSIHPRTSLLGYYSRFNGGLLSMICYILLYYAFISNVKKKDLPGLLVSTFTSGILVSIYGILEHFGHSISCLFAPGLKDFSASCWKQDVKTRVFATFGQPNWLAAYVITLLPLSGILAIQNKYKLMQKLFFSLSTILLFAVLIFTRSRSGMIGLVIGLITLFVGFILIYIKNKKISNFNIDFKFVVIILSSLILLSGIFGTVLSPSINDLLIKNDDKSNNTESTEISPELTNRLEIGGTDSGEIRKIVWEGGLNIWKRYPIIGSGVETFAYSYYLDRPREHNDVSEWDFLYNKAHNELINLLANSGFFGLATYLLILIIFGILVLKTILSNKDSSIKLVSIAILAGITGLFVSNFFGFSTVTVNVLTYIFFGIFVIINYQSPKNLSSIATKKINSKKTNNTKINAINGTDQYVLLSILGIALMIIIIKIYNYWDADKLYSQGKTYFLSGEFNLGIEKQIEAIKKSPREALYYDTLSDNYATLAIELAKIDQATSSAALVNEAIRLSDEAMKLNNRHLNFYKTRSRMFVTLAQLDEKFLVDAQNTLEQAIKLSPTDPKLYYTQAVINLSTGNQEEGQKLLEKALQLKPNYERARWRLATMYEENGETQKAINELEYILENITPNNTEAQNKILELEML
ncbi:MAG: O-antigen ligase family protein [Pseudomonadales bacterium]|nr:O-antigen ligase family protein [Pseudomonadales bacterium]